MTATGELKQPKTKTQPSSPKLLHHAGCEKQEISKIHEQSTLKPHKQALNSHAGKHQRKFTSLFPSPMCQGQRQQNAQTQNVNPPDKLTP